MKIISVIPAMNEATRIEKVIRGASEFSEKVVVVDDGSDDDTSGVAAWAGAIVIKHVVNLQKGAALKTGCIAAKRLKADIIVLLDADGQHDPADIPAITKPIIDGEVDVVFGCRKIDVGKKMPLLFKFGNWYLSAAVNFLFGIRLSDTQSGFRAFSAKVFDGIMWESSDYSVETEMITNVGRESLKFAEVPIRTSYDEKHKGTTIFDGFRIFWKLILWRLAWKSSR